MEDRQKLALVVIFSLTLSLLDLRPVDSVTDPSDVAVLRELERGLENPELLKWPSGDEDPCGPAKWNHVFCRGERVSQIQVQNLGLKGPLPRSFNKLSMLENLGFQRNGFTGALPSFKGLSNLRYLYLDFNEFDSIPGDFFDGLDGLEVMALDDNGFNASSGWNFPIGLSNSVQLVNLTCGNCNLVGPLPGFLGNMSSLQVLTLSGNRFSGEVPESFIGLSSMNKLWLNDQKGGGLTGSIDVFTSMESLTELFLHGNKFSGRIPESIGNLTSLRKLNLNGNQFAGLIPEGLASLELDSLDLRNNRFMGPIPNFNAKTVSYEDNSFCGAKIGGVCDPQVMALIEFLDGLNYPSRLVSGWVGNNPCDHWFGVNCGSDGKVSAVNLPRQNLNGTLSPLLASLSNLRQVNLNGNNIAGPVPESWTGLKALTALDLSRNNISPPLPKFASSVKLSLDGNPMLTGGEPRKTEPASPPIPTGKPGIKPKKGDIINPDPIRNPNTEVVSPSPPLPKKSSERSSLVPIIAPIASVAVAAALLMIPIAIYCCRKRTKDPAATRPGSSLVVHPRDPSDPSNTLKIAVSNSLNTESSTSATSRDCHVIEAGNLVISVQVLRNATKNFSPANELGRGGFGVVYRGDLDDGTKIAVKRMESGTISNKAIDEFQSEIAVLSKVRHRHLVSLLGYSVEGYERLLVYEFMPEGALSRHLFHWKTFGLEPLSWKTRLNIALDVARGMEYLHTLAHQSFIHRDLKSSNILLGDDLRAKVSDFGLVKLAPNGEKSVVTRLAGTFGYLAPEYAVTGKITTKADVFSFGVVIMELLTGMMALDEARPEEQQYLAAWFWRIKCDREKLSEALDPSLNLNKLDDDSVAAVAELAGHCTAREPGQRPDMGHAVSVLAQLVEKWTPLDHDYSDEYSGIDYTLPLNQMVKGWQESEGREFSSVGLEDSKGSIPARPTGFADSFTSADGR